MLDGTAAAYALLLGVVAAFNPCGFALLPAYIMVIVTRSAESSTSRLVALRRAVGFGLAMTLGLMAVFTAFGLLFGAVSLSLQDSILPYVSYVTVAIGVVLTWLGVVLVIKGELRGPGLRMQLRAPRASFFSQVGYGASFAVASLSCTIGLFLAVVSQALVASNPLGAVLPFVIYGVGMSASVVIVSLFAALAGSGVAAALRNKTMLIMRVGGVLMILAGLYVVGFGLAEILPRFGVDALNPLLHTTARWQASVTETIQSWGTPVLVAIIVAVTAGVVWVYLRGRGDEASGNGSASETVDAVEDAV
jgi:cytochrome c biogenesis protein CcdA